MAAVLSMPSTTTTTRDYSSRTLQINAIAGACGGIGLFAVGHPFDTLKLRMQTGSSRSMTAAFFTAVREHGVVKGLYAGIEAPLLLSMLYRGWLSICVDTFGIALAGYNAYLLGAVVGAAATLVEAPSLLVLNQIQSRPGVGAMTRIKYVWQVRGLAGFSQGSWACLVRNVPANSCLVGTFTTLKNDYDVAPFVAGCAAGVSYWVLTYPLDAVRGCLQAQDPDVTKRIYRGWSHCALTLLREGGLKRLYRGYLPCLIRAIPANGAFFGIRDAVAAKLSDVY